MIRLGLVLLAGMALALVAVAASGDAGSLTAEWLGWRLDTTAAAGAVLIGALALLAVAFWRLVIWIGNAPRRAALARAEARRREAAASLGRGFLALATGDVAEARRLSRRATEMADEAPVLTALLAAQSAEASGEIETARTAYEALLATVEGQGAGRRGLADLARASGNREGALEQARAAETAGRGSSWAWRMLFEDRLEAGDWDEALVLLGGGRVRKSLGAAEVDRARAAVLTARAALERSETVSLSHARDALKASALSPDFPPAAVVAAGLQSRLGRIGRAEVVLLRAWSARPHPAIALAYRDLRTDESPAERADRFARLIGRNPKHRESRILEIERALVVGDAPAGDAAAESLAGEPPSRRLLDLRARLAWAGGRIAEARTLSAEAAEAPAELGWSEIDPLGRAFAYSPSDWARVTEAWAYRHELLHPRHVRREAALVENRIEPERREEPAPPPPEPDLPPWRAPDDPGDWMEGEAPEAPEPTPAPRTRRPRRSTTSR
ncbi:heme biosynthesis HemY N-terminal domain-containing protein [Brevundimonas sp.]|uniref:heme biosynthesis HemY N-terminal domain-containing protein n=1 Tax=Brevundimonas sp. TaxID=1871086 RepID=UPI0025E5A4F8|nr:heme biosynthesis HemY N-terminal domain-containing protein [Brevundimonas sp.]